MAEMTRGWVWVVFAGLALTRPVAAADPAVLVPTGRFVATCEDLGTICFADSCGRDQIEAARACRAQCSHAVVLSVVPAACPLPDEAPFTVLRRRY